MAQILLADDDKGTRDLVARALQTDGHSVVATEDGSEALAALEQRSFELLVADVQMPGVDGIELATRALASHPKIKIVLMSGYAEILEKARALEAKGARLVTKPFSIEKIRAEVRAGLG
ncbi:MAG: response regulator [Proteobacteria bacterium]|nr:response regulator [Pseudomonadota bacterium]